MQFLKNIALLLGLFCAAVPLAETANAQQQDPATTAREKEQQDAAAAADRVAVIGPSRVALIEQATLNLPQGYTFVPKAEAARLLRANGNFVGDSPTFLGLVFANTSDSNALSIIEFSEAGYVSDEDAKNWDADALFTGLKSVRQEENAKRAAAGFGTLEYLQWEQPPKYDATTHRMSFAVDSEFRVAGQSPERNINYSAFVLGRRGFLGATTVSPMASRDASMQTADVITGSLSFNPGSTYADYNPATDKSSGLGLTALILGGAGLAKKLGLLGVIGAALLKFWQVIAVGVAGAGAVASRVLRGRTKDTSGKA